jgi:radical SAM protein with 4Fe4S-binding SPASM domain
MKAVVMRSNIHEFREIRSFCESSTKRPFRADCYLNLRHDYNEKRNKEIISERLSAVELGKILHKWTKKDLSDFKSSCANMFASRSPAEQSKPLFNCQAGKTGFTVSYDGKFKLCNSLGHRDYAYDLKKGKLAEAWNKFAPALLSKSSPGKEYLEKCGSCNLYGVCIWCPAFSYLEKSRIDSPVEYCCDMAHLKQSLLNS